MILNPATTLLSRCSNPQTEILCEQLSGLIPWQEKSPYQNKRIFYIYQIFIILFSFHDIWQH